MASGFLVLISFFTRIPIGKHVQYNENNFKSALGLYSLMGAVIGVILLVVNQISGIFHISFVKGLLLALCYAIVTGGIHFDGAADTVDGLFSGRTGERIFEIMSDSRIGAFGVLCLIFIVLSQFVLFSYISIYACMLVPIVGRCSVTVGCYHKKYAKNNKGMGTLFIESINTKVLVSNIIILSVFCILFPGKFTFIAASALTLLSSYLISKWIEKKIGGMTGDTCGFITEISQIIFMFACLFIEGLML